ncbi:MAG: methyltransferase family protein [Candidatus Bathyarchaeia archaeon]
MEAGSEKPEIKVLELLLYALIFVAAPSLTYLTGRWMDGILMLPLFPPFPYNLISGFTVFFSGLALGVRSTRLLYYEGRGLPWGELRGDVRSRELVVNGPYKYTRNPIILGYSMLPCGMGLMFQSLGMAIFVTALVIAVNLVVVKYREEPILEARFGLEYEAYRSSTPFLVPRPSEFLPDAFPGGKREGSINFSAVISLLFSLIGLVLLSLIATNQKSLSGEPGLRGFYTLIYVSICFLGMIAGFKPSLGSDLLHMVEPSGDNPMGSKGRNFRGHHPSCERFSSHILLLGDRALCAGCTGLTLGAALSILGVVAYLIYGVPPGNELCFFWGGFTLVFTGLIQHHIDLDNPYIHFILNVGFVIGTFFLFIAVYVLRSSFTELYLLGLILLWINTRIELSRADHIRVCGSCRVEGCVNGYR